MTGALVLWLALTSSSIEPAGDSIAREIKRADEAIELWDVVAAGAIADRLKKIDPDVPEVAVLEARVRFIEGRYAESLRILAGLEQRDLAPETKIAIREFRDFVEPLAKTAENFAVRESEHFRFYYTKGVDEILVRRGLETLETCYSGLAESFGVRPEEKIRVEVFPDSASFQKGSTLTRNEIETSGTIALCKFNRLMMITPRVVIRGFGWADTLCHEYVHYVLWKRNGTTVPIWLHEAVAKYEEVRWSGSAGSELTPLMKSTLKGALEEGKFVTFEQMHPSFAKLKNPHDVALASAEVLSIIRTIMARGGYPLLGRMLDALKDGADWRQMFERALGEPFEQFWSDWQKSAALELKDVPVPKKRTGDSDAKRVELRDPMVKPKLDDAVRQREATAPGADGPAVPAGPEAEAEEEAVRLTGRHARLGDLLRGRGRYRAAAMEYEKAVGAGGDDSPVLANRLGLTHRAAGELELARAAFLKAADLDPEYAPTLTNLGLLEHARADAAASVKWLERAARINPYDARIHEALIENYGVLGDAVLRDRAIEELRILRR